MCAEAEGDVCYEDGNICLDTSKTKRKSSGFLERLKTEEIFRHRIIHTFVIYWSFITVGWAIGMAGPAFPDLRQIVQVDLAAGSWLFTVGCIGYMIGSLLFGFLYDRLNRHILLVVCTFGFAVFNGVKPFCSFFPAMIAVQLVGYAFSGGLDTGANADIPFVWGSECGPYMQALHLCFCVGAILAPLATEPFLAKKICVLHMNNTENNLTLHTYNTGGATSNITVNESTCQEEYEQTRVQYAFLISTVISLSAAVGCVFLYCKLSQVYIYAANAKKPNDLNHSTSGELNKPKGHHLSIRLKIVFLILLSLLLMTYCIIEDEFGNFLMTFVITYLQWNKEKGSYATTFYWACFVLGRFAGIFLVKRFKQSVILSLFLISLALSVVGFWLGSFLNVSALVWIFTGAMGLSMSVIVPSIFSWTSENVVLISGKISAMFCVSASTGVMFFPILAGHLMELYTPMWLVYICLIVAVINLVVYLIIRVLNRICILNSRHTQGTTREITIQASSEETQDLKLSAELQ